MSILRINAWSSPRNISTAFMYAFAQREDTTVVDEPLYAHYLVNTSSLVKHPVTEAILQTQENDGNKVVQDLILGPHSTSVVLFKQMTHHLIELSWEFMRQTEHILLIRDPRAIIASYSKIIPNPSINDIGVKKQLDLYQYLQSIDKKPAIVDARLLLLNPRSVLEQLCQYLGLTFEPNMLQWEGTLKPDTILAR